MKKLLLMFAAVGMLFTACNKDCNHDYIEVDYNSKLAGTWTTIDSENEFAEALIFKADGTVTSIGVFEGGYWEKEGAYQIKGNKMTLSYEDGDYMESRFEMVEGEVFSLVDDELDVHFNYYYCEKDLSKEIVGLWVSTQEVFGQEEESVAINTYTEDGKAYLTAYMSEIDGYLNQMESDYKVIGNMLISATKTTSDSPAYYLAIEFDIIPNGTELGDIMTHYNPVYETTVSFLRVKQTLDLTGTYDYSSAYVSGAKGKDEDFSMLGHTFNMANIEGGNFDMLFRSELFCVDLKANSLVQRFRADGRDIEIEIPITVDGNRVTLDLSTQNPAYRKVDMYMFQDKDNTQLHMYMHTNDFINYFANMELYNLLASGEITPDNTAAIEKIYTDMEARIESINVSFVFKARK